MHQEIMNHITAHVMTGCQLSLPYQGNATFNKMGLLLQHEFYFDVTKKK